MNVVCRRHIFLVTLCVIVIAALSACTVIDTDSSLPRATDPVSGSGLLDPVATTTTPVTHLEPSIAPNIPDPSEQTSLPHVHTYSVQIIDPTCITEGVLMKVCGCGDAYEDGRIEPLGHSYARKIIFPTCTEGGYTEYICSVCGDRYLDAETPPVGHTWDDWETTKQPTAGEEGQKHRNCLNCGAEETQTIEKLLHQHRYIPAVTLPTCTDDGFTVYTCACGESYTSDIVEATGHRYTACISAPTCEEKGYTVYSCICGESYTGSYTEPSGHNWGEWTVMKEPTSASEGCRERNCQNCNGKQQETIDKLPEIHTHTYSKEKVSATCAESGYTVFTCACGDSYREEGAAPKGHRWGAWRVTVEPTTSSAGVKARSCEDCEETEQDHVEVLPAEGSFVFVSQPDTVRRNEEAMVTIYGQPGATYDIDVHYKSGESSAKGLEDKTADADGYVTWIWKIGGKTAPGTYQIIVNGNGESRTIYFTVWME